MGKKHKHPHHEEHVDETWLIPYADLLTLLLALFIVLFSMSTIDARKFQQLAKTMSTVFEGGVGVMQYPSPMPSEEAESLSEKGRENNKQEAGKVELQNLTKLQAQLTEIINNNNLSDLLKTSLTEEGLLITIRNDVLFDSGSATVRFSDRRVASAISKVLLASSPRNVIITGHTDSVPISRSSQFNSNWHLSVMRAVNFMSEILKNPKLDPRLFSAKGYGEFKPVSTNSTPDGRRKNRRVEILIMPLVPLQADTAQPTTPTPTN